MRFLILRILTHSELGMFHEYRRKGKEGSKQRAVNFDAEVVDRVFPAAKDSDRIEMDLRYETDKGVATRRQWLKRQDKNWRLEGNCPRDKRYAFVEPGCLFAMEVAAGQQPATGAWAVFPGDHPVTKSILSHGESNRLAGSAMIALHDDEGRRSWEVLARARPDLFNLTLKGTAVRKSVARDRKAPTRKSLPPNAARVVKMLSSVGHGLPSALADLVDNSINADATEIHIQFGRPDKGQGRWLTIRDNGCGMDQAALDEAMTLGSLSDYDENSLGRFGFGLKGASWSQAKVFTVVTRTARGPARHLTWDVADMDGWRVKSADLEPWESEATALKGHGTVVLWKDMRPPQQATAVRGIDPWSYEVMELERHLALVFHRFMEGKATGRRKVSLFINGTLVRPNNPVGHPLAVSFDSRRIHISDGKKDAPVKVQAWVLPSENELGAYHKPKGEAAVKRAIELIGLHGRRNETQGLFIYRNDRLIQWGGWHRIWETNDEKTKLARVIVNFDEALDDILQTDISKQQVQLPLHLTKEIKPLANAARLASRNKYRKEKPAKSATANGTGAASRKDGRSAGDTASSPHHSGSGQNGAAAGGTTAAADESQAIVVRNVKTGRFVWKLTTNITGTRHLQVSDQDHNLSALVRYIGANPDAVSHFSAFLETLDTLGVQTQLLGQKGG